MVIPKDHSTAVHSINKRQYTLLILYAGKSPYGPQGGKCGNVVDATEIFRAWWPSSTPYNLMYLLDNIKGQEFDLEEQIKRAKVVGRFNREYLKIKELPDDEILSTDEEDVYSDEALDLLEKRKLMLVPEEQLPLYIGHTRTKSAEAILEKRLSKGRKRCSQ